MDAAANPAPNSDADSAVNLTVNKLVQPRRAMQRTMLANAVLFFGLAMAIVVCTIDAHWLLLSVLVVVFLLAVFAIGPIAYAVEQRPHHQVRLHRAVGVVDLPVAPGAPGATGATGATGAPVEVEQRWYALVLRAEGKTYRLFKSIGTPSLVDEWLRRAAR